MKKVMLYGAFVTFNGLLQAQPFPAEVMAGHNYSMYQHTISKSFKPGTRWGVVHIANVLGWYVQPPAKGGMMNEFMNQGYIKYNLHPSFSLMAGYFYANVPDLSASFSMQYQRRHKDWLLVISSRMDVKDEGAFELFGMFEYRPTLTDNMKLYARIQAMTSHGPYHHNRSYQRLRLGVDVKKMQAGFAFNVDAYGKSPLVKTNAGIFLRKELL